jgi:hypothetical protein
MVDIGVRRSRLRQLARLDQIVRRAQIFFTPDAAKTKAGDPITNERSGRHSLAAFGGLGVKRIWAPANVRRSLDFLGVVPLKAGIRTERRPSIAADVHICD